MIYRFLILTILLLSAAACAPVTMNGDLISSKGNNLGPAQMSAFEHRGLRTFAIKAEMPDGTLFKGEMKFKEKTVTLYSNDGLSMNCNFEMNDSVKEFTAGGTGSCTTSGGQKLNVKF
ncbi:hypothetical protein [Maridesulfovibrio hydrothermalis]|uniref:Lipoprotein n=1 Tax=Maridesulfovibrio hydrothermalis AM13 = DSM 14728 TaxID=1121451 RepID=L0RA37_9BACT|nr:hypothetical protein [Maridesulfovibrio hydrothermalis]CCO23082.1 conserved exported protein of unknown function [Maridesulfovibrio hydrothermalis AM13 = DSM 14728]